MSLSIAVKILENFLHRKTGRVFSREIFLVGLLQPFCVRFGDSGVQAVEETELDSNLVASTFWKPLLVKKVMKCDTRVLVLGLVNGRVGDRSHVATSLSALHLKRTP